MINFIVKIKGWRMDTARARRVNSLGEKRWALGLWMEWRYLRAERTGLDGLLLSVGLRQREESSISPRVLAQAPSRLVPYSEKVKTGGRAVRGRREMPVLSGDVEQVVRCREDTDLTLRVSGLGVTGRLGKGLRTQLRGREASEAEKQRPERKEENKRP